MTTPAGTGRKIFINREPGATVLTLWGNMPLGDAGANEALAIEDPAEFAAELFRQLLEVRGIAVYGKQKDAAHRAVQPFHFHGHGFRRRAGWRRTFARVAEPAAGAGQLSVQTAD